MSTSTRRPDPTSFAIELSLPGESCVLLSFFICGAAIVNRSCAGCRPPIGSTAPTACYRRPHSRGAVHIARLTPGRSPATLAVIRSEAELRSLEAASFNPRMLRRIATGARATLLTATDFTIADGLFGRLETPLLRRTPREIDQPISIVFETEQIADRRNSPLNSRARISDGSGIRFFVVSGKIFLDGSMRYDASEQSSGSEGEYRGVVSDSRGHSSESWAIDSSR